MLKKRKDGTEYYYYYKRRVGRPKKRGRKAKKKKRGRSWQEKWNFKIIKTSFNKQTDFIGIFHNAIEAEKVKQFLLSENEKVIFPKIFLSNDKKIKNIYNTLEVKKEYLILERIKTSLSTGTPKLSNEYGKLIEQVTNSTEWKIFDKIPCLEEETFWIYGLHPKRERKDFSWIYENLIIKPLTINTDLYIRIFIYKNKVFFRHDDKYLDFVICKNQSDAIRMYNQLSEWCGKAKNKRCFFTGQIITCSERGRDLVKELQELTGWTIKKIRSKTT